MVVNSNVHISKFQIPPSVLETMLVHVEQGYASNGNHYHNHLHACDVLQTIHYFISETVAVVSTSENVTRTGFPVSIFFSRKRAREEIALIQKSRQRGNVKRYSFLLGRRLKFEMHNFCFCRRTFTEPKTESLPSLLLNFNAEKGIEKTFQRTWALEKAYRMPRKIIYPALELSKNPRRRYIHETKRIPAHFKNNMRYGKNG